MGMEISGRQLHHLHFVDDIVLITANSQTKRMLADFDKACGKVDLQLDLTKTMFMKSGFVTYIPLTFDRMNISECSSYVYLDREINMTYDFAPELSRRKRASWGAFKIIDDVV
ncbi:unnamed protein product [Angiostrongylus costaricensis]|uniref:Reverse transcriptase domain-containing protein n=1 Tax=Angiostrongylus costaricensis TaxID=334426 RepID=A0A0R3PMQ5_ANGCS|nr:unnamed protein product [Angiostrongylus costaricensis]